MGSYEVVDKMDCLKIGSVQIDYNLNIIFDYSEKNGTHK